MSVSRRRLLAGAMTGVGLAGVAGAARLLDGLSLLPPDAGGLFGPGHALTYATQRLITGHSMAREFPREKISSRPFANPTAFRSDEFDAMKADGFSQWRLDIAGMVRAPGPVSLAALRAYPPSRHVTSLACEEGWSYIAEWMGVPLSSVLEQAGVLPGARYVVYESMEPYWKDAIDMADALHPQTLVAYGFNGSDLPVPFGGPLRMRVPRQLGYKSVKYLRRLTVTDTLEGHVAPGAYSWYAGI
ncbi:MAG: molybdopterin-dependent oxidoreductase [Vicinamibacterales bacterium]